VIGGGQARRYALGMAPLCRSRPCSSSAARAPGARVLWLALAAALGLACAGGGAAPSDRYPEKKRPEPARSASDDEVLGAHRQDPADTLEGSLTNEHAAPRSPHAEEPAEAAHERLEHEECVEAREAESQAAAPGARRKRVCPPAPPAPQN